MCTSCKNHQRVRYVTVETKEVKNSYFILYPKELLKSIIFCTGVVLLLLCHLKTLYKVNLLVKTPLLIEEKLSVFWWYRNDVNKDDAHFRLDYVDVANAEV